MNEDNGVNETKMSFMAHLEELRHRLVVSAIAIGVGFLICYGFSKYLFQLLVTPLIKVLPQGDKLIYTSLTEAFFTYLKVGLLGGVLLASPVVFYQLWKFVSPGLYKHERKFVIPFVVSSSLLFMGGAVFGYAVVFPVGFKYFISFSSDYIKALPSVKQYFSFSVTLLMAFGVVFELPLVTLLLARMGVVTPEMMRKKRKYAIVLIFIVAAILTPGPDVISQLMMAGPLLILYEGSIYIARIFGKKKIEDKEGEEPEEAE
jgi:sec-independent protein translocase protein TatC